MKGKLKFRKISYKITNTYQVLMRSNDELLGEISINEFSVWTYKQDENEENDVNELFEIMEFMEKLEKEV